ncbi:MAG: oligosaccharide flippase family protein [Bacilli bacterium]|nr:oligosaccharide flippase family protein [Bacilli bacterium]
MKNKFIKSTIILIIGGLITKILGMVIKISLTRTIGTEGIGLYMMVLPTFNLFITLCNLGVPTAITKLVSEKKRSSKKIIIPTTYLILIYNIFLILIIIIISPFLAKNLLHNSNTMYPLMTIGLTLPFIAISSIVKGYFYGKEKVFPCTLSNIIEQIVRLVLTLLLVSYMMKYGILVAVTFVVLINIISEFFSIIILILFLPKERVKREDFTKDNKLLKEILGISIPTTAARMIGSFTYFLEPIILTNILKYVGYSADYITLEYGVINGYVYPLLLLPSFFTMAISSAILPVVSNSYSNRNYSYTKNKIKQAVFFSLLIGIPVTLIFIFIPSIPLKLVYNTTLGLEYISYIAPFFILHYIQAPLTSSLNGMGYSKEAMKGTLYGGIIKVLSLVIFSLFRIGLWSLPISSILNILTVTIHHIYYVNKYLKK